MSAYLNIECCISFVIAAISQIFIYLSPFQGMHECLSALGFIYVIGLLENQRAFDPITDTEYSIHLYDFIEIKEKKRIHIIFHSIVQVQELS